MNLTWVADFSAPESTIQLHQICFGGENVGEFLGCVEK